jgi:hypothetical protein
MKNPATIPDSIMLEIERRMARAEELQSTRRFVTRNYGSWHWSECSTPGRGYDADAEHDRRVAAARSIQEARETLRTNGYDVADVCSIARDPDALAHCDGGGALAADLR